MAPRTDVVPARVPMSKLRPPRMRHYEVKRTTLLEDPALADREILAIIAPAGYGKSTFAIQWASRNSRPVTWLTVDETDNDPLVLINGIVAAFGVAVPGYTCEIPQISDEPIYSRVVVPALLDSLTNLPSVTLVVDDAHHLRNQASGHVLRAVIDALPAGSQVAMAGRHLHALPIPLWRGQGRIADVRSADLAFSPHETVAAVRSFGQEVDGAAIHHAASGWPVAVYLLSQTRAASPVTDIEEFVEAEVLGGMDADLRHFVLATAPLGTVNPDLAASVTQMSRAGKFLAEAITTVLLQPTDGGWFTYHPLLQETVTALLERDDPALLRTTRVRSAHWRLSHGHLDAAVREAVASGDDQVMGEVVWEAARPTLLHGRARTVQLWLALIDPAIVDRSGVLSLAAAWMGVSMGEYGRALRHGNRAVRTVRGWPGNLETIPFGAHLALLQAVTWIGVRGPREALELATRARKVMGTGDSVSSLATLTVGLNRALVGDPGAEADLRDAVALAAAFDVASTQVEALSLLGLFLMSRGQQSAGCDAIEQASAVYAFRDLSEMASSSGLMALGRVGLASRRGREADVREAMAAQADVRAGLEETFPWYRSLSGVVLAEVSARLGDTGAYHYYLGWCDERFAGGGLCESWATMARQEHAARTPLSVLTPSELRVWELLKTRMTLSEIGDRLYLSRETVKSHTGAIYRKLGVASRREAQELAETWG